MTSRDGADKRPSPSAFDKLAEHFGIATTFVDAHGGEVVTSPAIRSLLLNSMGVAAENEAEAEAVLAEIEAEKGGRILPPVVVLLQGDEPLRIGLQHAGASAEIAWTVTLEDGSIKTGRTNPESTEDGAISLLLPELPLGYHQLELPTLGAATRLIVSPGQCWLPDAVAEGGSQWGIAVQLYLLRSNDNWGFGDFGDLRRLAEIAGPRGCDVIGLNPVHQMFLDRPELASPYSPASRLYLNPLYIDIPAVPEYAASEPAQSLVNSGQFQRALREAREARLVDYTNVTALKLEALKLLFDSFEAGASGERKAAFERFCEEGGTSLERSSLFQMLRQHFSDQDPELADWHRWPGAFKDPSSDEVRQFAEEGRAQIRFQNYMQFLADEQLAAAAQTAREAQGMAIGLYRDLAVGCDTAGAETWVNPSAFLQGTSVGAPPDIHNPAGQNWGLPPFNPKALQQEAYQSFVDLVRANMRHAGGLRIDHAMGLRRLYCIPEGHGAADGSYVSYPIDDFIAILALESHRHRCLVVGEDLGTVPPGFREKLQAANILSYRVVMFEQDGDTGVYVPPEEYPRLSVAVAGNHDLATLLAWWEGADLKLKESLGLYPSQKETEKQLARRERDRDELVKALRQAGTLPKSGTISAADFAQAAHTFLAATPSIMTVAQLDDMIGEVEPVNIPGTSDEFPNWRRKYSQSLDELADMEAAWAIINPLMEKG